MDTRTIANVEMARAWDGPDGDDWTDGADRYGGGAVDLGPLRTGRVCLAD